MQRQRETRNMARTNLGCRSDRVIYIVVGCFSVVLLWNIFFYLRGEGSTEKNGKRPHSSTWTLADWEKDQKLDSSLRKLINATRMSDMEKAEALLNSYPIFDAYNHLPRNLRAILNNKLDNYNFSRALDRVEPWRKRSQTDLPRLKKGKIGALFWVANANCSSQENDAMVQVLEQIDVIHQLVRKYPKELQLCTTSQCVMEASLSSKSGGGKIASLIGVEGGHSFQSSVGVLNQMYYLGVRYLTLTHFCNTPGAADARKDNRQLVSEGVTRWELELIDDMNRIGMIIDLSHASGATMIQTLKRSKAPVIFSHAGVKAVCNYTMNVGDDILQLLKENGGVIMISFNTNSVYCDVPSRVATMMDVVHHMEHIRDVIGMDYIGLGAEYDGKGTLTRGLDDVSKFPHLFACLIRLGWPLSDLKKIAFTNMIRVMQAVEEVKKQLSQAPQAEAPQPTEEEEDLTTEKKVDKMPKRFIFARVAGEGRLSMNNNKQK